MLNVMVTGLLCISMLLVASSCNLCLFTVKFYWNIKKKPCFFDSLVYELCAQQLEAESTFGPTNHIQKRLAAALVANGWRHRNLPRTSQFSFSRCEEIHSQSGIKDLSSECKRFTLPSKNRTVKITYG